MNRDEALEKLLQAYRRYYNINRKTPAWPFVAEAVFELHDEQYFLIKSAKISEADAKDFIFFASVEQLTPDLLRELDEAAWTEGLSRVDPKQNHRSSDVSLVILADHIDDECRKLIRKTHRSKSYSFGFRGYSQYRLIAYDPLSGHIARNRMGETLEKTIRNIFNSKS